MTIITFDTLKYAKRLKDAGFTESQAEALRKHLAPLLGLSPSELTPGRMTYDLRRLRLHGLIERRVPTATDSRPRVCKPHSSIPASTHASCARGSL